MTDTPITNQMLDLKDLKGRRDDKKAAYLEADAQYKRAEAALIQRMEDEQVGGMKVGETNFVPAETIYAQIQDKSEFVKWAQENDPELLEAKPIGERINDYARRLIDDNQAFPPGLGHRSKRYISLRSA